MRERAARESLRRRAASVRSTSRPRSSSSTELGSTRKASSLCRAKACMPPQRVASTGTSIDIASRTTLGKPSRREESAKRSKPSKSARVSFWKPSSFQREANFEAAICAASASFCGPSPAMRSSNSRPFAARCSQASIRRWKPFSSDKRPTAPITNGLPLVGARRRNSSVSMAFSTSVKRSFATPSFSAAS